MGMTHTINLNVPACPICKGGLKKSHITRDFFCIHCRRFFDIVDIGATEREIICEERKNNE